MAGKKRKWIAGAVKKPGSFTRSAEAAGKSVREYAQEKKDAPGTLGRRARLALTFEGMSRKSKAGRRYTHDSNAKASG